jgi:hypothetical protein
LQLFAAAINGTKDCHWMGSPIAGCSSGIAVLACGFLEISACSSETFASAIACGMVAA